MSEDIIKESPIKHDLNERFGEAILASQETKDDIPTLWVKKENIREVLQYLKNDADQPYKMLYDLTAIDERSRDHREEQPDSQFTVVYHLLSFGRNEDLRLKVL